MSTETKLCKHCKTEIPKDAKVCPNCKKKQSSKLIPILVAVLVVVIIGAVAGGGSNSDKDTGNVPATNQSVTAQESEEQGGEEQTPVEVASKTTVDYVFDDVITLIEEYKENEVAADAKYKNKTVQFTGIVKSIGKDILDDVYITVGDGTEITWDYAQCYFKKQEQIDKVTGLHEGDTVTVIGKIGSYSLSLTVKNCEIAE